MKQFEETLPLILETMLHICLMDVETTVRAAAKKVGWERGGCCGSSLAGGRCAAKGGASGGVCLRRS